MTQEALKMALEALITITDAIYVNSQQEANAVYKANDAITAIKEALAQPEQEPVAWEQFYPDIGKPQIEQPKVRTGDCLLVGVCASEGHKIQAKQEPWGESASDYERGFVDGMQYQMQSMSQSQQEPVEYQMRTRPTWEVTSFSDWKKCSRDAFDDYTKTPKLHDWDYEVRKLYTTPPQRTFVGLTDKEFDELDKEDLSLREFVQAIDDRLKEKNGA